LAESHERVTPPRPPGTARATVVVVTWNGADLLPDCLAGLEAQDLPQQEFGVLVVDNGSTDGTAQVLARYPWVSVLHLTENAGFAGGVASALRHVDTEYVVLLNNDARPEPRWLGELLGPLEADPSIVATTSKILLATDFYQLRPPPGVIVAVTGATAGAGAADDLTGRCLLREDGTLLVPEAVDASSLQLRYAGPGAMWAAEVVEPTPISIINSAGLVLTEGLRGADRGYLEPDDGRFDQACEVFGFCGGAAALRRSAVMAAGGMDAYLFLYAEDLDLSWRLRRSGGRIVFVPTARVRHLHGESSHLGSDLFYYYNLRNRILVLIANATLSQLASALVASCRSLVARVASRPSDQTRPTLAGSKGPSGRVLLRAGVGAVRGLRHALARRLRRGVVRPVDHGYP
jgi:N-acetylglucosaminyl-diphospho-decaprenol L-rhamnosyltransferase